MIIRDLEHLEVVSESPESTDVKGASVIIQSIFNFNFQRAEVRGGGANSNNVAANFNFQNGSLAAFNFGN